MSLLSKGEIQKLYRWTDAIAKLPLEICQNITQHLAFQEVFAAQRVSTIWQNKFGSPELTRPLLGRRCEKWDTTLASDMPDGQSIGTQIAQKAKYVTAYRTGKAFSMWHCKWDFRISPKLSRSVAYFDGILAFITKQNKIHVRDLDSGKSELFTPEIPEDRLRSVGVSSFIVAAITESGVCHIWELEAKKLHSIRVPVPPHPSQRMISQALIVANNTVLIQHDVDAAHPFNFILTAWRLNADIAAHARITIPTRSSAIWLSRGSLKIMLNSAGDSILYCNKCRDNKGMLGFQFVRLSVFGELQEDNFLQLPYSVDHYAEANISVPTDGQIVFWTFVSQQHIRIWGSAKQENKLEVISVVYDPITHGLLTKRVLLSSDDNIGPGEYTEDERSPITKVKYNVFFWKDTAYYRTFRYTNHQMSSVLKVIDFNNATCRDADMGTMPGAASHAISNHKGCEDSHFTEAFSWLHSVFMGDGKYLINFNLRECRVWCFDKNVTMADQDLEYKIRMNEERGVRLGQRTEA